MKKRKRKSSRRRELREKRQKPSKRRRLREKELNLLEERRRLQLSRLPLNKLKIRDRNL
jgi:hypothetical protein